MYKSLAAVLLALAVVAPGATSAADADHMFALRGVGALPCRALSDVAASQRRAMQMAVEEFSLGYVSAINRTSRETFDVLPLDQPALLANWVDSVCKTNADQSIEQVLFSILQRVHALRLAEDSPLLTLKTPYGAMTIRKGTLQTVQQALERKGLLKGQADGVFSGATRDAIRAYQVSVFQQPTGLPDPQTVVRLVVADQGEVHTDAKKPWWQFW